MLPKTLTGAFVGVACFLDMSTAPALAQTYTVDSLTSWSDGTVAAAATGVTVFVNSSGSVSVRSGAGNKVKGPYSGETVSIRCVDAGSSFCGDPSHSARIRIGGTGANTGRGLTITNIGAYSGTGTINSLASQNQSTVDIEMSGWTSSNQVLTFNLNCDWSISGDDSGVSSGAASSLYFVYAAAYPTFPSSGMFGTITANVVRSLTISKVSDLRFGTFIPPASGNAALVVDPYGARGTVNGSGTLTPVPSTFGPAQFNVTGEPGATFSLSYPSSFTMTGPGTPLSVTFYTSPAAGPVTLPASGAMSLFSGGSFYVSSGQSSGSYSGSFIVTISYN